MNNNGVNENQNLNNNDFNNTNGLVVDNHATMQELPEIVESMTVPVDVNTINSMAGGDNSQNADSNVNNSNNNASPTIVETVYIGGDSLDGSMYENMPSNDNQQTNFEVPVMVPDTTATANPAAVVNNTEVPVISTATPVVSAETPTVSPAPSMEVPVVNPVASNDAPVVNASAPVASVEIPIANPVMNTDAQAIAVPVISTEMPTSGGEIPAVNASTPVNVSPAPNDLGTGFKVSALGELKKKNKKKAKKAAAAADLERGKISVKALIFPFLLIIGLCCLIVYMYLSNERNLEELKYECSPINSSKNEVSLDVNSTIVKDLYGKVYTTIREDLAQPEWNDKMKIYLAYRQITDADKYESNCNLFNNKSMEPYTCSVSANFVPNAFTIDTLRHEWKMLYGEDTEMPLINIKLENSCIGGYEYIAERKEYVQGYCSYQNASLFKVSKKLVEATAIRNTIILKEEVKYFENEKMHLPDYLKSGDYYYTFKLDMNYNYVFVSKKYNIKY